MCKYVEQNTMWRYPLFSKGVFLLFFCGKNECEDVTTMGFSDFPTTFGNLVHWQQLAPDEREFLF